MAKQIQINLQMLDDVLPNALDHLIFELTLSIQKQLPCRILGYGVVEVPGLVVAPTVAPTSMPDANGPDVTTADRSGPIQMADHALNVSGTLDVRGTATALDDALL